MPNRTLRHILRFALSTAWVAFGLSANADETNTPSTTPTPPTPATAASSLANPHRCQSFDECAAMVRAADEKVANAQDRITEQAARTLLPETTHSQTLLLELTAAELAAGLEQAMKDANATFVAANDSTKCGTGQVFDPNATDKTKACVTVGSALSSGLLMQYGVSAGIAVAVHTPLGSIGKRTANDSYLTGVGVTPMGYIAAFPVYWFNNERARQICSRTKPPDTSQQSKAAIEGDKKLRAHRNNVAKVDLPNCTGEMFGGFVGIPSSFTADTVLNAAYSATNPGARTIQPLFSAGLVVDPFAPWLHFLLGVTYSNVQGDTSPGAPTAAGSPKANPPDLKIASWLLAVGGTFDVASLIIGAK